MDVAQLTGGVADLAGVVGTPSITSTTVTASVVSTTETLLDSKSFPANSLSVGDVISVSACGRVTTTGIGHPTILMRLRWGGLAGTQLLISGTMFAGSTTMTDNYWSVKCRFTVRSIGAAGEVWATGETINSTGAVPLVPQAMAKATGGVVATIAVTAIDQTAAADLALTATYSANTADNFISVDEFYCQQLRNVA